MKIHLPFLFLLGALVCMAFPGARAEKADRNKPVNVEADALHHDELKQTSVFSGRVVMTKGTIVLRGAQLEVRQDAQGFQHGVITAEAGQRAFFRQKRDTEQGAPNEFIEGEGERIDYDGRNDKVRLSGRAELRRYREATLTDELAGAIIVYNNLTDVFTVDGRGNTVTTNASSATETPAGRIRATLSPKEPAPDIERQEQYLTDPELSNVPALRPSMTLGSDTQQ